MGLGWDVGFAVGCLLVGLKVVGLNVGDADGRADVGRIVGDADGRDDGFALGFWDDGFALGGGLDLITLTFARQLPSLGLSMLFKIMVMSSPLTPPKSTIVYCSETRSVAFRLL